MLDHTGGGGGDAAVPRYIRYGVAVELSFQDDGRTLKVFLTDSEIVTFYEGKTRSSTWVKFTRDYNTSGDEEDRRLPGELEPAKPTLVPTARFDTERDEYGAAGERDQEASNYEAVRSRIRDRAAALPASVQRGRPCLPAARPLSGGVHRFSWPAMKYVFCLSVARGVLVILSPQL